MIRRIILIILILLIPASMEADTYYVDKDATGTGNGTLWQDAYTTIQSCVTAHHAIGDICEISGGVSGKTYTETIKFAGSGTTIQGTSFAGHNGIVTVDGGSTDDHIFDTNNFGTATNPNWVKNLTIKHTSAPNTTKYALYGYTGVLNSQDVTVDGCGKAVRGGTANTATHIRIKIKNTKNTTSVMNSSGQTLNFSYPFVEGNLGPVFYSDAAGIYNIYNLLAVNSTSTTVYPITTGAVMNVYNSHISMGYTSSLPVNHYGGGVANLYNTNILPKPTQFLTDLWRTDSESNTISKVPGFKSHRRGVWATLGIDNLENIDDWCTLADYATTKGVKTIFAASYVETITPTQYDKMLARVRQGHEVGSHSRHHMGITNWDGSQSAIAITGPANSTVTISTITTNNSSANWTGSLICKISGTTVATFDLSESGPYKSIALLIAGINAIPGGEWTAANGSDYGTRTTEVYSITLAGVADVSVSSGHTFSFQDNKMWYVEILEAKAILEAGMRAAQVRVGLTPNWECKVHLTNSGIISTDFIAFASNQANYPVGTSKFIGVRAGTLGNLYNNGGSFTLSDDMSSGITGATGYGFQLYQIKNAEVDTDFKIGEYNSTTAYDAGQLIHNGSATIYRCIASTTGNAPPNPTYWVEDTTSFEQRLAAYLEWLGYIGGYVCFVGHGFYDGVGTFKDIRLTDWQIIIDVLSRSGAHSIGLSEMIEWVKTSGLWTDADGNGMRWTRSFSDQSNYNLRHDSALINAGTDVGLTTDIEGNPIKGLPDIGAYEFQGSGGGRSCFRIGGEFRCYSN